MNWYILQTKPNAYATAYENLKRQGFDVFLPLTTKTTKKNGKFLDIKIPLFPGYLFMGTSINPIPWKSINGTRGISKVVTLDGVYRPISTRFIEGLKQRCNENGIVQQLAEIASDDRAKIERGPFAEFICTVDDIQDDRRALVLIDILQQRIKTKVSLGDISKIN